MPRIGVLLGTVALLGLGGYAALPDEEPAYLGDMPSMIERAGAAPSTPEPFVPPPPAPPPPPVEGPQPVVSAVPPPVEPPGAAERVPAPVTDVPQQFQPGTGSGDDEARSGLPDLLPLPAVPCVDVAEPGVGTIDCGTGELLRPVPELPIDPCSVEVPLPIGCPVVPPD